MLQIRKLPVSRRTGVGWGGGGNQATRLETTHSMLHCEMKNNPITGDLSESR